MNLASIATTSHSPLNLSSDQRILPQPYLSTALSARFPASRLSVWFPTAARHLLRSDLEILPSAAAASLWPALLLPSPPQSALAASVLAVTSPVEAVQLSALALPPHP